jgi:hypothetical protein
MRKPSLCRIQRPPAYLESYPERSQNHEHLHRGFSGVRHAQPLLAEIRELAATISARVRRIEASQVRVNSLLDNSREYQEKRDARQVVR